MPVKPCWRATSVMASCSPIMQPELCYSSQTGLAHVRQLGCQHVPTSSRSDGERSLHTGEVVGSIPTAPTILRDFLGSIRQLTTERNEKTTLRPGENRGILFALCFTKNRFISALTLSLSTNHSNHKPIARVIWRRNRHLDGVMVFCLPRSDLATRRALQQQLVLLQWACGLRTRQKLDGCHEWGSALLCGNSCRSRCPPMAHASKTIIAVKVQS